MVRRRTQPPELQPARLSATEMGSGISKLRRRISELEAFDSESVQDRSDPRIETLGASIDETLIDIFGSDTLDYQRYERAKRIDTAGYNVHGTPLYEVRQGLVQGKQRAIALLEQIIRSFEEKLADMDAAEPVSAAPSDDTPTSSNDTDVFLVHGKDEGAREEVARFITKTGLNPIILHERPSKGRTIIEKLEDHADVGFAVVLLTPDDIGAPKGEQPQARARQNVIAELFFFIGKLGRARVCALKKGELEIPSDIGGVIYIDMDARGAWRTELLRELEAAGYSIDWGEALR